MVHDDQLLSETIISDWKRVAARWKAQEPLTNDLTNIVEEYKGLIDGVSTVFGVVGHVWNIYSSMEKEREEAAARQAMCQHITQAGKYQPISDITLEMGSLSNT